MNSANVPEGLEITDFLRKQFPVGAVQVSDANIQKVAEWCGGSVENPNRPSKHVKVDVTQPMNERQTKAFVGDWVLYVDGKGFKVFTKLAFEKSFERAPKPDQGITVNVFTASGQGGGGEYSRPIPKPGPNPGGNNS